MFDLSPRTAPTFYFIGVTTGQSSARTVWPAWMAVLGRSEIMLEGVDLPLHADPADYRRVVEHIKRDPLSVGALVTTHKIDLLDATRDLFDTLGPYAQTLSETSSIAKRDGRLIGDATDPIASALTLNAMLGPGYFGRTGGDVLCLGAGGAASAISLHFMTQADRADRPLRFLVVDLLESRLVKLRSTVQSLDSDIEFAFVQNRNALDNDRLMTSLPAGSLVINATGMGKDRPGSPLTNAAIFPQDSIAWELNYRGALDFHKQALAQQSERNLQVEDGWIYFLHGWSQVIAHVLDLSINEQTLSRFTVAANSA